MRLSDTLNSGSDRFMMPVVVFMSWRRFMLYVMGSPRTALE